MNGHGGENENINAAFLLKNCNFKLIASSISHILVLDTWICLHIAARLAGVVVRVATAT